MPGRPAKRTIDYFPHFANTSEGMTMYVLENRFGNDGFAVYYRVKELLCNQPEQLYDYNETLKWQYLVAKMRVSEERCSEILTTLAELEVIDKELHQKKILWSQELISDLEGLYARRLGTSPERPKVIIADNKPIIVLENTIMGRNNTQSKQEYSKQEYSKQEYTPESSEIRLATKLKDLILKNDPKAKIPVSLQSWADEINKIFRLDQRTWEQIEKIIDFSQNNDFWKSNVLSATSLRRRFATLLLQESTEKKKYSAQKEKKDGDGTTGRYPKLPTSKELREDWDFARKD